MGVKKLLVCGAAVLLGAGVAVWAGFRLAPVAAPPPPLTPPTADAPAPLAALLSGTTSCSARGCHGSLTPPAARPDWEPVQFDEYTRWANHDPHTRAYATLFTPRSAAIVERLRLQPAHEEARCLACHVNPVAASPTAEPRLRSERLAGVGCEACHGSARDWLRPHTSTAWQDYPAAHKQKLGLKLMGDAVERARACVGCHVGGPGQDVNHDLIAAGHPRLNFELTAFLANLPPHWNVKAKKPAGESEPRTWAVGQAVSAEAALALLAHRAAAADAPWPEFAEYNCFACHHDLQPETWRQQAKRLGQRKPGAMPWGSWYFALPGKLATPAEAAELKGLGALMARPYPARAAVTAQAGKAQQELAALRQRLAAAPGDREALRRLLAEAVLPDGTAFVTDWEVAEQLYLAAQVVHAPSAGSAVHRRRAFAPGFDSPRCFRPEDFLKALTPD